MSVCSCENKSLRVRVSVCSCVDCMFVCLCVPVLHVRSWFCVCLSVSVLLCCLCDRVYARPYLRIRVSSLLSVRIPVSVSVYSCTCSRVCVSVCGSVCLYIIVHLTPCVRMHHFLCNHVLSLRVCPSVYFMCPCVSRGKSCLDYFARMITLTLSLKIYELLRLMRQSLPRSCSVLDIGWRCRLL